LGCCEPTALSAYASIPESRNDFEKNCYLFLANTGSYNIGLRFQYIMIKRLSIVTADQRGPLQVPLSESTSVMIVD
jgi:hypothetical protein